MPELIAQGTEPQNRWRRSLPKHEAIIVGRQSGGWSVPWDDHISRHHASIEWDGLELIVEKLDSARNPIFYQGGPFDRVRIGEGQHFVIGTTVFTLVDEPVHVAFDFPLPVTEQTYSSAFLRRLSYRDSAKRVEVLSRLPDVIAQADDNEQLVTHLVNLLMSGIPTATNIAVVEVDDKVESSSPENDDIDASGLKVLHWDRRQQTGVGFSPSRRLVHRCLECRESVLHIWEPTAKSSASKYTISEDIGWSFVTPIWSNKSQARDSVDGSWVIYISGRIDSLGSQPASDGLSNSLQEDIKFTEVVASTVAQILRLRKLERNQSSLRQFFSPVVLSALAESEADDILEPRETDVAVLFCDLRGFSRATELEAHDLLGLLQRVSHVLGLTTRYILEHQGVVGDFHGDATMGFWGWPLAKKSYVTDACQAALAIRTQLLEPDSPTSKKGLQLGLGLATGRAVAGKIGTQDQVKVTVFGPVVNLASRLESLTRRLRASILIDEQTAEVVRTKMSPKLARVRRVAPVLPFGFKQPLMVHELLPGEDDQSALSCEHLEAYEAALDAMLEGDWNQAWHHLHEVPAEDEVKDFLTIYIAQHNRQPPEGWDGVIRLDSK